MLVITLGDPFSINIEMLVDWLVSDEFQVPTGGLVVIGSGWHWREQCARLGTAGAQAMKRLVPITELAHAAVPGCYLWDVVPQSRQVPAEKLSPLERGQIATRALQAVSQLSGQPHLAVVTGPIDKHACQLAGFSFPGQTEYFAHLWSSPSIMVLAGPRLRVALVTNHLPLRAVADALSVELVAHKLQLFATTLRHHFAVATPRIAVLGLNPHAGDGGLFGDEEQTIIAPAVAKVAAQLGSSAVIRGPIPSDTAFYAAYTGSYDGVLAMYHDQGLGPLKTVHFDTAVNLTGGLPHLRVSPDHGPAADLFLSRRASPASWRRALALAREFVQRSDVR